MAVAFAFTDIIDLGLQVIVHAGTGLLVGMAEATSDQAG